MNILVVTTFYWPENFLINDVTRSLAARGHSVTVLTTFPNYPLGRVFDGYRSRLVGREEHDGVRIVRVPSIYDHSLSKLRRIVSYASLAISAATIGLFAVRGPVDRIMVFQPGPVTIGFPGLVLGFFRRVPVMMWIQDLWPEELLASGMLKSGFIFKVLACVSRWIYGSCDALLLQSEAYAPALKGNGVLRPRFEYLPNWVDANYRPLIPVGARKSAEGMEGKFNILYAGNIGYLQDFESIVDTAALLRDDPRFQFVVLGDGVLFDRLVARTKELGLRNILWKGRKPAEEVPVFASMADALLVQLRGNAEFSLTLPSKVQAYMACGKPILGAVVGEAAEVLRRADCGSVVEPSRPELLRDAIIRLAELPPSEQAALGRNARLFYEEHFSKELLMDRLEQILQSEAEVVHGL